MERDGIGTGETAKSVALIYNDFEHEIGVAANPVGMHQIEATVEAVRKALEAAGRAVQGDPSWLAR